jgi:hypothetical protein
VPGTHHSFLVEPLVDGWCSLLSAAEPAVELLRLDSR